MKVFLILALLYAAVVVLKALAGSLFLSKQRQNQTDTHGNKMVQDPVCQVYLPRDRAIEKAGKEGPVYFCSEKCAEEHAKKDQAVG